jgi:cation transport ATPase
LQAGGDPGRNTAEVLVRLLGHLVLCDQPRQGTRDALAATRALAIGRCLLLTGDCRAVAEEVGKALGMDEVVNEVLPRKSWTWSELNRRPAHGHDGRRRSE